jgi:hypothetical protein
MPETLSYFCASLCAPYAPFPARREHLLNPNIWKLASAWTAVMYGLTSDPRAFERTTYTVSWNYNKLLSS